MKLTDQNCEIGNEIGEENEEYSKINLNEDWIYKKNAELFGKKVEKERKIQFISYQIVHYEQFITHLSCIIQRKLSFIRTCSI